MSYETKTNEIDDKKFLESIKTELETPKKKTMKQRIESISDVDTKLARYLKNKASIKAMQDENKAIEKEFDKAAENGTVKGKTHLYDLTFNTREKMPSKKDLELSGHYDEFKEKGMIGVTVVKKRTVVKHG